MAALTFGLGLSAQQPTRLSSAPVIISGDTAIGECSAGRAAVVIQQWFSAMSAGDTTRLRRLASPAFVVFSAGHHGLREPVFRADSVSDLLAYVARRHRAGDRLTLLEIEFGGHRGGSIGFMPIFTRESRDPSAVSGLWTGKSEFRCHRGVAVMNLVPWPDNSPPYHPGSAGRRTPG
jgi:hypothetical protein